MSEQTAAKEAETVKTEAKKAAAKRGELTTRRFRNPREALGHAVALLRAVEPFASYRFGRFSASLAGQIRRGHYLFTFEDGKLAGYIGWARCSEAVAEAWVSGEHSPAYRDCLSGECLVAMTFFAKARHVTFYQARQCRELNPNCKVYIPREYSDKRPPKNRAVFNRIAVERE